MTRKRGSRASPAKSHIVRPSRFSKTPEPVLGVHARAVVRLLLDELGRRRHARQTEHVQAPRRRLAIGSERRPARDHRVREPIHVRPMLLEQPCVVAQHLGARSVAAVDEEIHPEASLDLVDPYLPTGVSAPEVTGKFAKTNSRRLQNRQQFVEQLWSMVRTAMKKGLLQ